MVSAGVPNPIGQLHASEIAETSLGILEGIQNFVIPHMPRENIQIRIGIHSGKILYDYFT